MGFRFTFDQARCTGCQACVLACTIENELEYNRGWRAVHTFNERRHPALPVSHLSLACNHCDDPACLKACPAGAYSKDGRTGFVVLDEGKCIGCTYCTWACPFGAPKLDARRGVIGKCTFCSRRRANGENPACVDLCPTGALGIDEESETTSNTDVPGFPMTKLAPSIDIHPASESRGTPNCSSSNQAVPADMAIRTSGGSLTIKSEWPLVVFTFATSLMVALTASVALGDFHPRPTTFAAIAGIAMLLSLSHLGRKKRAWRALRHVPKSWLSREVLAFGLFAGAGIGYLLAFPDNGIVGAAALMLGACTLLSIDMVYATLPLRNRGKFHSADTTSTGLLLTLVFLSLPWWAAAVAAAKLGLYLYRKTGFRRLGEAANGTLSAVRVGLGFLTPAVIWAYSGTEHFVFIAGSVLVGELIDRFEFYGEIELVTPERQMREDTLNAITAWHASDRGRS